MKTIKNTVLALALFVATNSMAQECVNNTQRATPSNQFIIDNDGTVTDRATNLMWKYCEEGQTYTNINGALGTCSARNTISEYNWGNALKVAPMLNVQGGFAGHNDWRLPNLKEMASLLETSCINPAINTDVFPLETTVNFNNQIFSWTSTPSSANFRAWAVKFYANGISIDEETRGNSNGTVRLVRNVN